MEMQVFCDHSSRSFLSILLGHLGKVRRYLRPLLGGLADSRIEVFSGKQWIKGHSDDMI